MWSVISLGVHWSRARWLVVLIGWSLGANSGAETGNAEGINGYWVMPDGSALIEVYSSPRDDEHAARIVALREKHFTVLDEDMPIGEVRRDVNNPDKQLQKRPLLGLTIARGLKYSDGTWTGGRIYDPASGKTYRCKLELVKGGFLRVRGYLGIALLGRTLYWQRAAHFERKVSEMFNILRKNPPQSD